MRKLCPCFFPIKNLEEAPYVLYQQTFKIQDKNNYEEIPPATFENRLLFNSNSSEIQKSQKASKVVQENIIHPIIEVKQSKNIKKKYNPDDYRYLNEKETFKIKAINSINKQQFSIDNCHHSQYYIFDITANIYVDDCSNCILFIAPCQSTVFIRNCKQMKIIAATQQFRTYQCHDCEFSLFCQSQPVIESSTNLIFTSFETVSYSELRKQFFIASLQIWNNHWSQIHDFSKKNGQNNFKLQKKLSFVKQMRWKKAFQEAKLTDLCQERVVPFVYGQFIQNEQKYPYTALIIINQQKSKQIEKLIDIFEDKSVDKVKVLKANFNKKGNYRQKNLFLLINYQNYHLIEQVPNFAKVIKQDSQIQLNLSKYFVSYGYQRAN